MKYAKIRKLDVTNGPGVRTTIFVSGCTHNCEGCFNKEQQVVLDHSRKSLAWFYR